MRRAVLVPLLAGLLIGACRGDDDESSADDGFCKDALAFMQDGEAFNDPSSDAAREALDEAKDLDPPDEIADDWQVLIEGSKAMADADLSDPAAIDELPPEVQDMGAASTNVFRYLSEECGLEVSG